MGKGTTSATGSNDTKGRYAMTLTDTDIIPPNILTAVSQTANYWALADEALSDLNLDPTVDRIVFKLSRPTNILLNHDAWVYRSHVTQLALRVMEDGDTTLPTHAEILCLMSDLSLNSPFRPAGMLLYCESFRACASFAGVDYREFADDEYIAAQVKSYGVLRDDLMLDVMSKLQVSWRVREVREVTVTKKAAVDVAELEKRLGALVA